MNRRNIVLISIFWDILAIITIMVICIYVNINGVEFGITKLSDQSSATGGFEEVAMMLVVLMMVVACAGCVGSGRQWCLQ